MPISVHYIELPADEIVNSRVIHLSDDGGNIGRLGTCDIHLPDKTRTISRKHADIRLTDQGYVLVDHSQNGVYLNNKKVIRGKKTPLNDGDIIKIKDFQLLISIIESLLKSNKISKQLDTKKTHNSLTLSDEFIEDADTAFDDDNDEMFAKDPVLNHDILSDDPFTSDPFDDEESENQTINSDIDAVQQLLPETNVVYNNEVIEKSLFHLIDLVQTTNEKVERNTINYDFLFYVIDITVKEFVLDFKPEILQSQFEQFITSWHLFNKEKQYWKIYSRYFQFRYENNEYSRQFKSLFIENLQKYQKER